MMSISSSPSAGVLFEGTLLLIKQLWEGILLLSKVTLTKLRLILQTMQKASLFPWLSALF